jgi:hypothetical protein
VQLLPADVAVTGPRSRVTDLRSIETTAVDRASLSPGVNERTVDLLSPGGQVQLTRTAVAAQIVVERDLTERTFDDVKVALKGTERRWRMEPGEIRLVVRGPRSEVGRLELAPGAVYIDPTSLTGSEPFDVRPEVTLPPGFEVVHLEPETIRLSPASQAAEDRSGEEPSAGKGGEKA